MGGLSGPGPGRQPGGKSSAGTRSDPGAFLRPVVLQPPMMFRGTALSLQGHWTPGAAGEVTRQGPPLRSVPRGRHGRLRLRHSRTDGPLLLVTLVPSCDTAPPRLGPRTLGRSGDSCCATSATPLGPPPRMGHPQQHRKGCRLVGFLCVERPFPGLPGRRRGLRADAGVVLP